MSKRKTLEERVARLEAMLLGEHGNRHHGAVRSLLEDCSTDRLKAFAERERVKVDPKAKCWRTAFFDAIDGKAKPKPAPKPTKRKTSKRAQKAKKGARKKPEKATPAEG